MTPKLAPGMVLLRRHLTPEQRAELELSNHITVPTHGGDYVIHVRNDGIAVSWQGTGLCVRTNRTLPPADQALTMLLCIRVDPIGFGQTANHETCWPRRRYPGIF